MPKNAKSQKLYMGEVDTPHFTFHSFGKSEEEAKEVMMEAWKRHVKATGADPNYLTKDEVNILEFEVGKAYRDGSEI